MYTVCKKHASYILNYNLEQELADYNNTNYCDYRPSKSGFTFAPTT